MTEPPTCESEAICRDCGTMRIRICPCCDQQAPIEIHAPRVTTAALEALELDPRERARRPSSNPPPIPAAALKPRPDALATKLLAINQRMFGPIDALDLTDEILEDSEELGQDQIDVLFKQ